MHSDTYLISHLLWTITSAGHNLEDDTRDMKASTDGASDDVSGEYLNLGSSVLFWI